MNDPVTRHELLAAGRTAREIAAAVHRGDLVRARRGQYLPNDAPPDLIAAVRVGGRLACVSELRARGIWSKADRLHVHVAANAARLRHPAHRDRALPNGLVGLHWGELLDPAHASAGHVSVTDAVLQSARCLPRRLLHASLDSAVRTGRLRRAVLREDPVLGPLLGRIDTSAESGLETIVRELARDLGFSFRTQVPVDGVGFVDVIVEDWIAVECDGAEFHTGAAVARDRRRDAALASAGYTVLRLGYPQIMFELPIVASALIRAVGSHRRVRDSGARSRRALQRMRALRIS